MAHHFYKKKREDRSKRTELFERKTKWLERRLLATCRWHVVTAVAFPQESESILAHHFFNRRNLKWGVSSAGRAPALQAGGHRFDPGTLHQKRLTEASGDRGFIESLEDSKMYLEN